MRRIGVLMGQAANDPEGQARIAAFLQGLQELGWSVGRNVRIDIRWSAGNADDTRKYAAELVAFAPQVILSSGTPSVAALQQATRTVPTVFTVVADPVGARFVDSMARPGGNATGFISLEYGLAGNGWNCSRRSLRARRKRQSFVIPPIPPGSASSLPSGPRRRRSGWK